MMGISRHVYDNDGYCIWCSVAKDEARTKNCPLCPYDDGCAYLEEVSEP